MPNIDRLVGQIIRQTIETVDRPQIFIVSVRTASGWKWYYYEAPFKELTRREFELDTQNSLAVARQGRFDHLLCHPLRICRQGSGRLLSPAWKPSRC